MQLAAQLDRVGAVFAQSDAFFSLPQSEKEALSANTRSAFRGYVQFGEEKLEPAVGGDIKECFNAGPDLDADDPDVRAGKPFHAINKCRSSSLSGRHYSSLTPPRSNLSSCCTAPLHTISGLTRFSSGLEERIRDGGWIEVPPATGTFVCNIGDCLMRWTNDVYVSNQYRVVNRSGRKRYSIAYFGDPNSDALVSCLRTCLEPGATQ